MTRILIVDDNPDNRRLMAIAARGLPEAVLDEAINGQDALNHLQYKIYDLILLDLQMPGVNGIRVYREIRAEPRHSNTIVVVATANPHMTQGLDLDEDADYVLQKPIDPVAMRQFLSRVVARHTPPN